MHEMSRSVQVLLFACAVVVIAEGVYLYYLQTRPQVSMCQNSIAAWEKAMPEAAAAKEAYTGTIAPINFDSPNFPEVKNFTNAISDAVKGGPNFAGHFVIAEWGCGTNCQDHAIVDVITGNIVAYGIPSERGLSFNVGSSLIMTNPSAEIPSSDALTKLSFDEQLYWYNTPREYYALSEHEGTVTLDRLCIENSLQGK